MRLESLPWADSWFFTRVAANESAYASNRYRRETERLYAVLDERLSVSPYLAGADYSIADMSLWGWARISDFVLGDNALATFPALRAWFDRVDGRPAAQRAKRVGADIAFKRDFDEEAHRAMFPQNYPAASSPAARVDGDH